TQKFAIVQEFSPDDNVAEGPTSIIISEPTMLFTISPSPTVSVIQGNEIKQPKSTQTDYRSEETTNKNTYKKCNIFDGRWVYNPNANPYYDSNTCPFIEEKMNCQNNGRPDFQYQKWRWEPKDCDIPLFDGRDMLERLRNKRVILVGDSLNRNMWESLACLLYISVHSSRTEVDAKGSDYKVFKAK
ncbi:Protein trichome birefringence-like 2, partial [Bienertia sinuspersici]